MRDSAFVRVLRRVVPSPSPNGLGDCWIFTGALSHNGYGQVGVGRIGSTKRGKRRAHRVVYEATYGPIPEGYQIDHLCKQRACVRPDHLEAVTQAENLRRQHGLD